MKAKHGVVPGEWDSKCAAIAINDARHASKSTWTSITQAYSCAPWKAAKLTDEEKAAEKERRIKEAIENSDLIADKSLGEDDKYNTVIEDQYESTSFPLDITYPAQLISKDGSKIYYGSFARIQFHVSEHISSLQIILGNLDKRYKDVSQFKATIRFPATAIRMMQIVENDKHGEYLSKDLDNKCWYMERVDTLKIRKPARQSTRTVATLFGNGYFNDDSEATPHAELERLKEGPKVDFPDLMQSDPHGVVEFIADTNHYEMHGMHVPEAHRCSMRFCEFKLSHKQGQTTAVAPIKMAALSFYDTHAHARMVGMYLDSTTYDHSERVALAIARSILVEELRTALMIGRDVDELSAAATPSTGIRV
ncbi:hypothetical protein ABEF95_003588 [Exophiala dermatitidis]